MAMMVQPRGAAIEVANAVFEPRKQWLGELHWSRNFEGWQGAGVVLPESLVIHGGATSERRTRVEVCNEVMVMGMDHDSSMGYGF